jgi:hypothetical protein
VVWPVRDCSSSTSRRARPISGALSSLRIGDSRSAVSPSRKVKGSNWLTGSLPFEQSSRRFSIHSVQQERRHLEPGVRAIVWDCSSRAQASRLSNSTLSPQGKSYVLSKFPAPAAIARSIFACVDRAYDSVYCVPEARVRQRPRVNAALKAPRADIST